MKAALAILAMIVLGGCVPWRTTEQPSLSLHVVSNTGAPIEGASVQFKKVKLALLSKTEELNLTTDAAGAVHLPGKADWHMVILAPDGNYSYEWFMCIQKAGFQPVVVNNLLSTGYEGEQMAVLLPAQGSGGCIWSEHYPFGFNIEPQPTVPIDVPAAASRRQGRE